MELNKELYNLIDNECDKFKKATWDANDVDVNDVVFSYLFSTNDNFYILNDWDEGKNNDPFWDEGKNEHSCIVFLKEMCLKIDKYYEDKNKQ